ncbi:MAG: hypothetical protein GXP54_10415 [Deltaproteobacteria bacterium]|nr:hypothetical protein [Deltaproteobacteria bacterium]
MGFSATLVVGLGLSWGSIRAAARLHGAISGVDRVSAVIAIAMLQIALVMTGLAAAGVLYRWTALPSMLALSAVLAFFSGNRPSVNMNTGILDSLKEGLRDSPSIMLVMLPGAAAVAMSVAWALTRPPLGYDALNYHIPLAAHYLQSHDLSLFHFPAYYDPYPYFPAVGEMFTGWAFLLSGDDLWLPLVNLPFLALLILSLYGLCREAGAGRTASVATAMALSTVPAVFNLLTESYVELPLWAFFLAALRWSVHAARRPSLSTLMLTVALAGILPGIKQVGLVMAPLVLVFYLALGLSGGKSNESRPQVHAVRSAALFTVAILVFGSVFYIRNWLATGNPIYPYPVEVLGIRIFDGTPGLSERAAATSLFAHLDFLWESGKLVRAFLGRAGAPNSSWGMGPVGALSLALGFVSGAWALWAVLRRRVSRITVIHAGLFLVGIVMVCLYAMLPRSGSFVFSNVRFVYPGVALLAVVAAGSVVRTRVPEAVFVVIVLLCQAAGLLFFTNLPTTWWAMSAAGFVTICLFCGWFVFKKADGQGPGHPPKNLPRSKKAALAAGLAVLGLLLVFPLHSARESNWVAAYRTPPLAYQFDFTGYAPCLQALEENLPKGTLALAGTRELGGFVAPLFGADLGREVVVVEGGRGPAGARLKTGGAMDRWYAALVRADADALMVFLPRDAAEATPESGWAHGAAARFREVHRSSSCELFMLKRGGDSSGGT